MENKKISYLRKRLNKIDDDILKLLSKRFKIVRQIGEIKIKENLPLRDKKREKEIIKRLSDKAKTLSLPKRMISQIYQIIFENAQKEYRKIKKER